ncbi:MAG: emp24/gp25L/p24 family protein [Chloroflexi bacterium]|nr:emp24/gp25L/p24 family protein [Chloroflexota bacterium]
MLNSRVQLGLSALFLILSLACGGQVPLVSKPTPTPSPLNAQDSVAVAPGTYKDIPLQLNVSNRVVGQLDIQGGSGNDVKFTVFDPFSTVVVNAGIVSGQKGFSFIASVPGTYTLRFDNSFSTFSNKIVKYQATIYWR